MTEEGGSLTEGVGTLTYMDPLVARGGYDKRSDFYSYCVVAYEVLSGEFLPQIKNFFTVTQTEKNIRPPFPESIPEDLKEKLLSGFEENLDNRSSWNDVIESLST